MSKLVWDEIGSRTFDAGVQQGVLYLLDGRSVPWNGLISVEEAETVSTTPIYFDGFKFHNIVETTEYQATVKAITYPTAFAELDGSLQMNSGVYVTSQDPQMFNFSYKTMVGDDLNGVASGYKLHMVYNVLASASATAYETLSSEVTPLEFEWQFTGIPEDVPGFKPSCHLVFDSRFTDPTLLFEIERRLYGGEISNPDPMTFSEMTAFVLGYFAIEIVDNKDGTWTANDKSGDYISVDNDGFFEITDVNAIYSDANTYTITNTQ